MTRFILHPSAFILLVATFTLHAQTVRLTEKPDSLVHGTLNVPVVATDPVVRIALFINNVKFTEAAGKTLTAQVKVGDYIRRLRFKAVGYDAAGSEVASDEMVVNDPRPPFRVHLSAPAALPKSGTVTVTANVIKPVETVVSGVDFFVAEEKIGWHSVGEADVPNGGKVFFVPAPDGVSTEVHVVMAYDIPGGVRRRIVRPCEACRRA